MVGKARYVGSCKVVARLVRRTIINNYLTECVHCTISPTGLRSILCREWWGKYSADCRTQNKDYRSSGLIDRRLHAEFPKLEAWVVVRGTNTAFYVGIVAWLSRLSRDRRKQPRKLLVGRQKACALSQTYACYANELPCGDHVPITL